MTFQILCKSFRWASHHAVMTVFNNYVSVINLSISNFGILPVILISKFEKQTSPRMIFGKNASQKIRVFAVLMFQFFHVNFELFCHSTFIT